MTNRAYRGPKIKVRHAIAAENGPHRFTDRPNAEVAAQDKEEEEERGDDGGHLMLLDQSESADQAAEHSWMPGALSRHVWWLEEVSC